MLFHFWFSDMFLNKKCLIAFLLGVHLPLIAAEPKNADHTSEEKYPAFVAQPEELDLSKSLNITLKLMPEIDLKVFSDYAVYNYIDETTWAANVNSAKAIDLRRNALKRIQADINHVNFNQQYQKLMAIDVVKENGSFKVSNHSLNRIPFESSIVNDHARVAFDNMGEHVRLINKSDIDITGLSSQILDTLLDRNPLRENAVVSYRIVGVERNDLQAAITKIEFFDESLIESKEPMAVVKVDTKKYPVPSVQPLDLQLETASNEDIKKAEIYSRHGLQLSIRIIEEQNKVFETYCTIDPVLKRICKMDGMQYGIPLHPEGEAAFYPKSNGTVKVFVNMDFSYRNSEAKLLSVNQSFDMTRNHEIELNKAGQKYSVRLAIKDY